MIFGREHLHPGLAWLAVAWLVTAVVADAVRKRRGGEPRSGSAFSWFVCGAIALPVAVVSGEIALATWTGRGEVAPESAVFWHRVFGYGAIAVLALRLVLARRLPSGFTRVLDALLIVGLALAAWHGMTLTYLFGVNVDLPGSG